MHRLAMILSLAAFALFNYTHKLNKQGLIMNADAQPPPSANAARAFHK